jgi:hypothetical protein
VGVGFVHHLLSLVVHFKIANANKTILSLNISLLFQRLFNLFFCLTVNWVLFICCRSQNINEGLTLFQQIICSFLTALEEFLDKMIKYMLKAKTYLCIHYKMLTLNFCQLFDPR